MSHVVIYVFLLDNLTGFSKALNETLLKHTPSALTNSSSVMQNCDPGTTNQILNAVSKELELDVMPMFKNKENPESQETLYNALLEASIPETELNPEIYDKALDTFDFDSDQVYRRNNKDNENDLSFSSNVNVTEFPKYAPFLVAIFETMSNLTAQTCAGTLLSPQWVLTATTCVNILSSLYANDTNITQTQTLYTVVAGAIDPLVDGSAHNVTTIFQPHIGPNNSSRHRRSTHVETHGPYLAMMKIEPEFDVATLSIVEGKVKKGDVMIYGWILSKNDSGLDSLTFINISALILSEAECQAMYSYYNNDIICLFNNDKQMNIAQLSSGGPVLMLQEGELKLLAVAQTDEHVFIAYPLHVHIDWINKLLNTK